MSRNLNYDGVGFNAEWVGSFKTEKQFIASPDVRHLFLDKSPEARVEALQQVYSLCSPPAKPAISKQNKSEDSE